MNIYVYTEFVDECVGNRFNGKKTADADYILLDKVDDAEHILGSSRSVWQVSQALKKANFNADDYLMLITRNVDCKTINGGESEFAFAAAYTGRTCVYSNYITISVGEAHETPVIAPQIGSVREDFNMGSIVLYKASEWVKASEQMADDYDYAAYYFMRLMLCQNGDTYHIRQTLYQESEFDSRSAEDKQFDYVNPNNELKQLEMQRAYLEYSKLTGSYIDYAQTNRIKIETTDYTDNYKFKVSVIIPVRNREKTIEDAVKSALSQKLKDGKVNVIVVDNFSTDKTTDKLIKLANENNRLYHIFPSRTDLGIGGCWMEAVRHEACGLYCVQLDSDDVYQDENTLQKIVDTFEREKCAMVIGSYSLTDFDLNPIPPGLIAHKEWTDKEGPNNAVRINGLGAPRAFFTPVLVEIPIPNASYGEDYAVGLQMSKKYKIGRIYDSLYCCRRWGGNSDSSLSVEKINANNNYKDSIRTIELLSRGFNK